MKTVWKFPIDAKCVVITAPVERFLTAQMQGNTLCVWALVDTEKESRSFGVSMIGTGWPLEEPIDGSEYIATVQDGISVWHIFATR